MISLSEGPANFTGGFRPASRAFLFCSSVTGAARSSDERRGYEGVNSGGGDVSWLDSFFAWEEEI